MIALAPVATGLGHDGHDRVLLAKLAELVKRSRDHWPVQCPLPGACCAQTEWPATFEVDGIRREYADPDEAWEDISLLREGLGLNG